MKILILCTGNSCRSQMAHGFLQSFDPALTVRSAGTQPSDRVNPRAVGVMKEVGIDIGRQRPVHVDDYVGEKWNYVITVCDGAKEVCPVFTGEVKQRMHIGFEDPSDATGTEEYIMGEFRRIRDLIGLAFHDLYDKNIKTQM